MISRQCFRLCFARELSLGTMHIYENIIFFFKTKNAYEYCFTIGQFHFIMTSQFIHWKMSKMAEILSFQNILFFVWNFAQCGQNKHVSWLKTATYGPKKIFCQKKLWFDGENTRKAGKRVGKQWKLRSSSIKKVSCFLICKILYCIFVYAYFMILD